MYSSRLANCTLELLRNRPRTLTLDKIASDTELTVSWLRDFGAARKEHASVTRVERLYSYLANKKLELV